MSVWWVFIKIYLSKSPSPLSLVSSQISLFIGKTCTSKRTPLSKNPPLWRSQDLISSLPTPDLLEHLPYYRGDDMLQLELVVHKILDTNGDSFSPNHANVWVFLFFQISHLITTITISSNVIGAFAALFFTNHSVQLWSDSVIRQLAVIGHP